MTTPAGVARKSKGGENNGPNNTDVEKVKSFSASKKGGGTGSPIPEAQGDILRKGYLCVGKSGRESSVHHPMSEQMKKRY